MTNKGYLDYQQKLEIKIKLMGILSIYGTDKQ